MPVVENSPRSPCWQQQQIAAQNSYRDSVRQGKEVVYVAPCKAQPLEKTAPQPPAPPRTT